MDMTWAKSLQKELKKSKVKERKMDELPPLLEEVLKPMNDVFSKKNDSIAEVKKIQREQFVRDSIAVEQKKQAARAEYLENYRKTHDWRELKMSTSYVLDCGFCDKAHLVKDFCVMSISADTIYYLSDQTRISILGNIFDCIHYSALTRDFKNDNNFKDYVKLWSDSIANHNSMQNLDATLFNALQYNEFKQKLRKKAPNGFIQNWGWHLNTAEGIEPHFSYFNTSEKTIKYVDFYFSVYNAVGDRCYLKYENSYVGSVRGVGPIETFDSGIWEWDKATHYTSADANEMKIVKLVITYMDGTTKTIPQSAIVYNTY